MACGKIEPEPPWLPPGGRPTLVDAQAGDASPAAGLDAGNEARAADATPIDGTVDTDGTSPPMPDGSIEGSACSDTGTCIDACTGPGCLVTLASGLGAPRMLAIDSTSVYWTSLGGSPNSLGTVTKVGLMGGAPVTLAAEVNTPYGIAVNANNVYFTTIDAIVSVPLGGGSPTTLAGEQEKIGGSRGQEGPRTGDRSPLMSEISQRRVGRAYLDIPPSLEQLLLETLVKDPASRIPSVEAFAARLAPFGTAVARRSYDQIRRLASRPPASRDASLAKASPASAETVDRPSGGLIPATDASIVGSSATDGGVSDTSGKAEPRRVPWRPIAALGVAAALGLAVTASRLRHEPAPASADSPVVASVHSASTEGASVPAIPARGEGAPDNSNPTTAVVSASAEAPPTAETRPASRADTTSTTGARGAGTVATQPTAGNVAACASGATAECEAACAANRPGSCVKLAESLEKGVGAPKNLGRAITLYTQGCDQGSAVSCTDLGTMHYQGEGVEKNAELGVKFLSRGCGA